MCFTSLTTGGSGTGATVATGSGVGGAGTIIEAGVVSVLP